MKRRRSVLPEGDSDLPSPKRVCRSTPTRSFHLTHPIDPRLPTVYPLSLGLCGNIYDSAISSLHDYVPLIRAICYIRSCASDYYSSLGIVYHDEKAHLEEIVTERTLEAALQPLIRNQVFQLVIYVPNDPDPESVAHLAEKRINFLLPEIIADIQLAGEMHADYQPGKEYVAAEGAAFVDGRRQRSRRTRKGVATYCELSDSDDVDDDELDEVESDLGGGNGRRRRSAGADSDEEFVVGDDDFVLAEEEDERIANEEVEEGYLTDEGLLQGLHPCSLSIDQDGIEMVELVKTEDGQVVPFDTNAAATEVARGRKKKRKKKRKRRRTRTGRKKKKAQRVPGLKKFCPSGTRTEWVVKHKDNQPIKFEGRVVHRADHFSGINSIPYEKYVPKALHQLCGPGRTPMPLYVIARRVYDLLPIVPYRKWAFNRVRDGSWGWMKVHSKARPSGPPEHLKVGVEGDGGAKGRGSWNWFYLGRHIHYPHVPQTKCPPASPERRGRH